MDAGLLVGCEEGIEQLRKSQSRIVADQLDPVALGSLGAGQQDLVRALGKDHACRGRLRERERMFTNRAARAGAENGERFHPAMNGAGEVGGGEFDDLERVHGISVRNVGSGLPCSAARGVNQNAVELGLSVNTPLRPGKAMMPCDVV